MRLLRTPFQRQKVARHGLVAVDDTGIRREHHIRQVRHGVHDHNVGYLGNDAAQLVPL